jgi:hypothetical protein
VKVLLAGMLAGTPGHGGATWAILQWVHGLERLGHDVVVVEPVERIDEPAAAYFRAPGRRRPSASPTSSSPASAPSCC